MKQDNVSVHPHIQAGKLLRDLEDLHGVRFGEETTRLVGTHIQQIYSHFWELLEKAELRNSKHE